MARSTISHYRILRKLGAGGMGEVFLAEDTALGRRVAIKMLPESTAASAPARQRLINEARAIAALDHPNICAIHEVGEEDDRVFIVMPFIDGETLADRIRQQPLPSADVVNIGVQAAQALEEAHAAGIVHRDIKPQNIIVTSRGQVKVLDFGLAMFAPAEAPTVERLTIEGSALGTPGFMSPEQLRGGAVDARSDIFSLGVTLYECATGHAPFGRGTLVEVAMRVMTDTPPPPSTLNPAVPAGLDAVITRAMAKDPALRYQSAGALRTDLIALTRQGDDPPRVASTPRAPRSGRTRRIAWVAAAVVTVTAAASVGLRGRGHHVPPADAVVWYERGTSAIREGAYFQASKALERALAIDHAYVLARTRQAEAYAEMGLTESAREELLQAMALLPDRSALSAVESAYVDAVAATLARNFTTAIDKYSRIVDEVDAADKGRAYVDLGRAYEKNEDLTRALDSYLKATQLDPQSAAAFLRLGILYGRRQELPQANAAFARAEEIYSAMSSQEGLAEAHYQMGAVLARIRKLPEAREQLERSLTLSRDSGNEYQAIRTSLQLSNVYYAAGDSARAKATAVDAVQAAQRLNSRMLAANGLIDLGYTLLARGEYVETREYLQQALDLARREKSARLEARARLALGSLNTQQGRFDDAVAHLEAALAFYQPGGYRTETANALILLGRAYRDKGDYAVARKAFEEQLELARRSGDPARLAASHSSLGVLLGGNQEMYAEALPHFDESYRINASIGARVSMGFDLINRADSLAALGRYDEAAASLAEAHGIAADPRAGFKLQLAYIDLVAAQIALSQNHNAVSAARASAALQAAGDYPDVALQAREILALSAAASGASARALAVVTTAAAAANESKLPRLVSTALLTSAEVRLASGDARGALADAQAAQQMFAKGTQLESEWRAWLVAARAARLAGDRAAAQEYAARAEAGRAALQARWGDTPYHGYAQRPDVKVRLNQLGQLVNASKTGQRQ